MSDYLPLAYRDIRASDPEVANTLDQLGQATDGASPSTSAPDASCTPASPSARSRKETLKALGASKSTKFVLPLELSNLLQAVAGYAGAAFRSTQRPSTSDGSTTEPASSATQ